MPSPKDGILVRVGKPLKLGDRVKEGQALARLDDRLIRGELAIRRAKVRKARPPSRVPRSLRRRPRNAMSDESVS